MLNLDTSFFNYMVADDSNLSPTRKYERNQFRNRINGYAESFRRQNGFKELQHEYGKFASLARKLIKEEGLVQQNKNEVDVMLKNLAHAMQSYRQSPNEYDYITLRQALFLRDSDLHRYNECAIRNLAWHKRYERDVDELNSKYGADIPKFPFDHCSSTEMTKVEQLLKDAKAGKPIHYELPDYFQYYDDNGLKELAALGVKFPGYKNYDDESLNELKAQYRQFCHVARPLTKQVGLVPQNKSELEKLIDETQKAMRGYLHSQNRTDADYDALQRRLRAACQKANDYEATAKRNLERYGEYRKNVAELHDTYGIDIPVFPFDYCGSDEEMKIDGLLEDAKAGKPVKYELPDYYDESELNAMGIVTQRCDSMKAVANCVENEARYIPANETVAHDIDISRTGDGRYAVQSELPRNISTDGESDTEPSNVGDVLQSRYPNGDISISFGGATIPFDALRDIDAVDVDGNMVPVPDDPDALRSAVSKGWESGSQDIGTPINSFPSLSTRAAAPSTSARDRAKTIRNGMRKWEEAEEETVWVTAHFRSGIFINLYPRSRPHRNGNGNVNGNGKK